ncbi:Bni4p [Sugiyamaella lignohabitans]|uniref:Bni4p n=1 Tax=Sugiyamaella lignohabitans TaxID=796027 RepID=A0A167F9Q6_9ASCO|nr:Bni4p [Sugiyamaella lignohabitans]ANB15003.1 Bni4p [Sugiyamaella lignohabitans]
MRSSSEQSVLTYQNAHRLSQQQQQQVQQQLPPQLVLPSDIRRSSMASSRSVSSPAISYSAVNGSPGGRSPLHSRTSSQSSFSKVNSVSSNVSPNTSTSALVSGSSGAPQSILKKSKSFQPESDSTSANTSSRNSYFHASSNSTSGGSSALRGPRLSSVPAPPVSNPNGQGSIVSSSARQTSSSAKTGPPIRDIRVSAKSQGQIQPSYTAAPPAPPPASPPPREPEIEESTSSNKFGSKLKRALFGGRSKSSDKLTSSASSINFGRESSGHANTASSASSVRSFSISHMSSLPVPGRKPVDSDTRSMFSMRSTSSTTSTLRKIGSSTRSLFRRSKDSIKSEQGSSSTQTIPRPPVSSFSAQAAPNSAAGPATSSPTRSVASAVPAPQLTSTSLGIKPLSAATASAIVTATVVQAEHVNVNNKMAASSSLSSIQNSSEFKPITSQDKEGEEDDEEYEELFDSPIKRAILRTQDSFTADEPPPSMFGSIIVTPSSPSEESSPANGYESENIPSLTSSTESPGESDDVEITAGDTVFPKTLDLLNVANIRSSLERTKSLERRRSKRSVRNGKDGTPNIDEKADETGIPNATEIHVAETDANTIIAAPTDAPAPRSILKSSASSIDSVQLTPDLSSNGKAGESFEPLPLHATNEPESTAAFDPSPLRLGETPSFDTSFDTSQLNNFGFNNTPSKPNGEHDDLLNFSSEPVLALDFDFDQKSGKVTRSQSPSVASSPSTTPSNKQQQNTPTQVKKLPTPPPQSASQDVHKRPLSVANPAFDININNAVINNKNIPHSHYRNLSSPPVSMHHGLPSPGYQQPQTMYHPLYQQRKSYHGRNSSYGSNVSASSYFRQSMDSAASASSSNLSSKSNVNTVSFSSRIVIYDTYGRSDYDRRPEIATCNRLTPLLAQQIKEELNNFKSEMEIHADSKIFTHFF